MEEQFTYKGNFTKADVVEIYCKTIANLGPANVLFGKNFSYIAMNTATSAGASSSHIIGYLRGLEGYIAIQVIGCQEPPARCSMDRTSFGSERSIKLENIEDKTLVTVSESARGLKRVKKALDQVLG